MPSLRETVSLQTASEQLLADPTGNRAAIQGQVLDAARPTREGVLSSLDQAGTTAGQAFDTAEGTLERRQRGLGQTLSDSERRVQKRRLGLGRALSQTDARNRRVGSIRERTDIARAGAGSLRDIIEGQELSGRSFFANAEAERERQFQAEKAAHKSRKMAGLGTVAAIGLSFVPGGAFLAPAASAASQAAG